MVKGIWEGGRGSGTFKGVPNARGYKEWPRFKGMQTVSMS